MLARLPLASHGLAIHSTSKLLLTRTSLFFILSVQTVSISQQLCICSTELGSACVLANKNRQETLRLTPVCRVKGHQAGPMSATGRNLPTAAWRLKGFSNMRDLVVPFDALILYFHLEEPPPTTTTTTTTTITSPPAPPRPTLLQRTCLLCTQCKKQKPAHRHRTLSLA